jgi:hypothetical protein
MANGFKTFTGGTGAPPLSAADVNGYLMQQVTAIFTSATTRDAALPAGSIIEGQKCYTQDTNTLWVYDGAAWRPIWTQQNGASTYSQMVVQYPDAARNGTAPTSGTVSKPFAIQAGTRSVNIGAIVANQAQVNFLQSFPNGCLTVIFSPGDSRWDGGYLVSAVAGHFNIIAKSGGTALTTGSVTVDYIAIGF